jgi:hypothetical protein
MDMQHGYKAWACSVDMQHGHAGWAFSIEMKHGHAAWNRSMECSKKKQHQHAWICMDMHY